MMQKTKANILTWARWKNRFQKQSFTDLKLDVLKNLVNSTGKHLCWNLFLIKLKAWSPATLLKRNFSTGVFLWNLQNFLEHLFLQKSSIGCFWSSTNVIKGFGAKAGANVSDKYQIHLKKCICCRESPKAATVGVL